MTENTSLNLVLIFLSAKTFDEMNEINTSTKNVSSIEIPSNNNKLN